MQRMCANNCGKPAVYVRRGRRKARNDHDLCGTCFRNLMNAVRAATVKEVMDDSKQDKQWYLPRSS